MGIYKALIEINEVGTQIRLIDAKTEASALKHASKRHITITRPTSAELVALGKDGCEIEQAE